MRSICWFAVPLVLVLGALDLEAAGRRGRNVDIACVNCRLQGQVVDFTCNHGADRRIWSPALGQKRAMYVYLPPNYDAKKAYPLFIFLHGAGQDEKFFLQSVAEPLDRAIAAGTLPPYIVVAPDGSLPAQSRFSVSASFFVNSLAGNYEDFVQKDVWQFVTTTFPILPERKDHVILGVSMGGTGAFAQAIKYKERYKTVLGFMPAVNLRWVDCCGRYASKFDPNCWGWRAEPRPREVIARPGPLGILKIRAGQLFEPLVGCGPDAIARMSEINPIEILSRSKLQDKELNMYIAYGGRDQFNIDTQVESFLYFARQRGITVSADFYPCARHDVESGLQMIPKALEWLGTAK